MRNTLQNQMPAFAIVIPNFNQSHFLPTALESLRHQDATFSVALMDGGSTDPVDEVANRYADVITFFRSAPDGGQASAIREGFEQIPGDVVCWLNADDYYYPGTLDRVTACFEQHPEVDVVYGDAVHVTPEGFFLSYFLPVREYDARAMTRTDFICQPSCFVRRAAYERVGKVDPSLRYTMDWDLWCRLSEGGAKFYYLKELLAAVRYYPGTKTLSGDRKRYEEIWRIEKKYGRRLLPWSWPGCLFFELSCRERCSLSEKFLYSALLSLRWFLKAVTDRCGRDSRETLHGFHRWQPLVEGVGRIHLPWYDQRQWKRIDLRITPRDQSYRVRVNDRDFGRVQAPRGVISVEVSPSTEPCWTVVIERVGGGRWRLLRMDCALTD